MSRKRQQRVRRKSSGRRAARGRPPKRARSKREKRPVKAAATRARRGAAQTPISIAALIERHGLLEGQRADGSFSIHCDAGPATTAKVLIALQFAEQLDQLDAAAVDAVIDRLCEQQDREEGWFPPWPARAGAAFGPEDQGALLSATATVLAALKFTGRAERKEVARAIARAQKYVDRTRIGENHGLAAVIERGKQGDYSALLLAMAGLIPVSELPPTPIVFRLVPGSELVLEQRVNLGIPFQMLTYDVIRDFISSGRRPPQRLALAEAAVSLVRTPGPRNIPDLRLRLWNTASDLLRSGGTVLTGWRSWPERIPAVIEGQRLAVLLGRYENSDGSWLYGDTGTTAMAIASLHALGADPQDGRILRGRDFLERQIHDHGFGLFQTDVWATAFRVRSLLALGMAPWEPPIARALGWLVSCQKHGSWAFQARNNALPDTDDTAMALATLALALEAEGRWLGGDGTRGFGRGLRASIEEALLAGRDWLLARQNADGGWAAFQHGFPSKPPGPFMTGPPPMPKNTVLDRWDFLIDPPPELGDPATEDITGRVLFALGHAGLRAYDQPIARALDFLRRMQMDSGAFWGRWVSTYLPSTCWVLRGLAAVGADLSEPWVQRAIAFVQSRQNEDGGWGESLQASRDPDQAGIGESTRYDTAGALLALQELGPAADVGRIEQGLDQLAQLFGQDSQALHPLVPPESFYSMPGIDLDLAREAWGASTRNPAQIASPGQLAPRPADRATLPALDDTTVEQMSKRGDPLADSLLPTDPARLTSVLAPLMAIDGPGADPEEIRLFSTGRFARLLEKTEADIDDHVRKAAQAFFRTHGWAIASCLFCSSLPQAFAFPKGAAVLRASDRFARQPQSRIVETMQFVLDVATGTDIVARRSIARVRLLHAALRTSLVHHPEQPWNVEAFGLPINQQHILGTILTFSQVVCDGLRALGLPPTAEQEDSWLKLWTEVALRMGLDPAHRKYLATPADAAESMDRLREQWDHSDDGAALAQSLVTMMKDFIPGDHFDGLPVALVRHMAGDRCADLLDLPAADWSSLIVRAVSPSSPVARQIFGQSPMGWVGQAASWRVFVALTEQLRPAKGKPFRIPADLLSSWQQKHGLTFVGT